MPAYRLTFANSTLLAPAPAGYDGDLILLPTGELLIRRNRSELGGLSDIFRSIGLIGAAASGPIAAAIPGVSNGVAGAIGAAAQAAAALFLVPKPPGGPAKGLAAIQAFCNRVLAALDAVTQAASNGQIDRATAYAQADQLAALLSDPTAVYQAQHGDDANALNAAKSAASQKVQAAKAAADTFAATGKPAGAATTAVIDPATGQLVAQPAASLDITTIAIIAAAGLALGWVLG